LAASPLPGAPEASMQQPKDLVTCSICQRKLPRRMCTPASALRPSLADRIRLAHPDLAAEGHVCFQDLSRLRGEWVNQMLENQKGELSRMEDQVLGSIRREEILARKLMREDRKKATFGQRAADHLARFGGSWIFLMTFAGTMAGWIGLNVARGSHAIDPYPFILLNLMLSCLAAVQAPIIMMSQNRQEGRDRKRAESDYQVNLKAELEIRSLHEKMDHLLDHQWQYLMEIQQIQVDLMEEIARKGKG
jgi:uncharacterized membrane protein